MTKDEIVEEIKRLKKKRNAVILVHNYQIPEVQDIADFLGDSLDLSRKAATTKADVIVFCGVNFMAETAKILSPEKTVLLPSEFAGCPLADMITLDKLNRLKKQYPSAAVVTYVNSTAIIKANSDICCTSANAVDVVQSLQQNEVIFVPDRNLGHYVSTQLNSKRIILNNGYCPTHIWITKDDILNMKSFHPEAKVIVHPECNPEVVEIADEVLSTGGMVRFAKNTDVKEIIVATEMGIIYRLKKENPKKEFYPASPKAVCSNMKLTNLENVMWSLQELKYEIEIPKEIIEKAKISLEKMIKTL